MDVPKPIKLSLLYLRLGFAGWLLYIGFLNLDRSFLDSLPLALESFAQQNPFGLVRWLLYQLLIPQAETIGILISVGQLVAGSALFFGFFTRQISYVGIIFSIVLFSLTFHLGLFYQTTSVLLGLVFFFSWQIDLGQAFGLDALLFRPAPPEPEAHLTITDKKQKEAIEALAKSIHQATHAKKERVRV